MTMPVAPFHCPYCGEEDLRPSEAGGHDSWDCASCSRAFALRFLGLLPRPAPTIPSTTATMAAATNATATRGAPHEQHNR